MSDVTRTNNSCHTRPHLRPAACPTLLSPPPQTHTNNTCVCERERGRERDTYVNVLQKNGEKRNLAQTHAREGERARARARARTRETERETESTRERER